MVFTVPLFVLLAVFSCVFCNDRKPDPVMDLHEVTSTPDSVTVIWSQPNLHGNLSSYKLTIQGSDGLHEEANVTVLKYTFSGLETCLTYNVSIVAVNQKGMESNASRTEVYTRPRNPPAPTGLTVTNTSSTSLESVWDPVVVGNCTINYVVELLSVDNRDMSVCDSNNNNCTFNRLLEYTEYIVKVRAYASSSYRYAEGNYSNPVRMRTSPDKSGQVQFLTCSKKATNKIYCTWHKPIRPNGEITGYLFVYNYKFHGKLYNGSIRTEYREIYNTNVNVKKPAKYINITISAINELGPGHSSSVRVLNEFQIPAQNKEISNIVKKNDAFFVRDPFTQIPLSLPKELDESLGIIHLVTLVVKEIRGNYFIPSVYFEEYQNKTKDKTYTQTSVGYADPYEIILSHSKLLTHKNNSDRAFVFIVGEDSLDNCTADIYCNGPLKHGTSYEVGLRAYSDDGFRTYVVIHVQTDSVENLVIILACVFGILFLCLIGFAIKAFYLRKKQPMCGHRSSDRVSFSQEKIIQ